MNVFLAAGDFRCAICRQIRKKRGPTQTVCGIMVSPSCWKEHKRRQRAKGLEIERRRRLARPKAVPVPRRTHDHLAGEMKRLYAQGLSSQKIARILGGDTRLTGGTVLTILRRHGVATRPPKRGVATYTHGRGAEGV